MNEPHGRGPTTRGPSSDEAMAGRIFDALSDLLELLVPHVQECAERIGLAAPYALALRRIDGSTPMKDLAQRLHCDPSFVTAIADVLEERRYARRESDAHDRRVRNLVLTRSGIRAKSTFERELALDPPGIRRLTPSARAAFLEMLLDMARAEEHATTDAPAADQVATRTTGGKR